MPAAIARENLAAKTKGECFYRLNYSAGAVMSVSSRTLGSRCSTVVDGQLEILARSQPFGMGSSNLMFLLGLPVESKKPDPSAGMADAITAVATQCPSDSRRPCRSALRLQERRLSV
jgi:hypothetical protein